MTILVRVARVWSLIFALAFLCSGCTPSNETQSVPLASEQPRHSAGEGIRTYAELETEFSDIVRGFPLKSQSEAVAGALVESAVREGIAKDRTDLMARESSGNLGLYLFDQEYESAVAQSVQEGATLAKNIQEQFPNTALAALAFDRDLSSVRNSDEELFLSRCTEVLAADVTDRRRPVVLLRRAEYYRDKGDVKASALDYLNLWSYFPDKISRLGLRLTIDSVLRDADLHWEAATLELSQRPELAARRFLDELDGSESTAWSAQYWPKALEVKKFIQAAVDLEVRTVDDLEFVGRAASTAMYSDDVSGSQRLCLAAGVKLLELYPEASRDTNLIDRLHDIQQALQHETIRAFSNYKLIEKDASRLEFYYDRKAETEIILPVAKWGYQLAMLRGNADMELAKQAVDGFVGVAELMSNREAVIEAYESMVARYENSEVAPEYLERIGDLYRGTWKAPSKAVETYSRLRDRYPSTENARSALSKVVLCLFELERYDDAHLFAQQYMVDYPTGSELVGMELVAALSERALGLGEESEAHLREIAEKHRLSPLAPEALYQIGAYKLGQQDYIGATEAFEDLLERYPESDSAKKAGDYIERLKETESREAR
jgi:tetratricopeptide (TPR) repeat protein